MTELFQVLTPAEALDRLLEGLPTIKETEEIPVQEALGRVLAANILSPAQLPTFPRSNMDGYAVRSQDTFGASDGLPAALQQNPLTGHLAHGAQVVFQVMLEVIDEVGPTAGKTFNFLVPAGAIAKP